jgi:hypothetical protein
MLTSGNRTRWQLSGLIISSSCVAHKNNQFVLVLLVQLLLLYCCAGLD